MSNELREPISELLDIERDPQNIRHYESPTEDEQLLAVSIDPTTIRFIKYPDFITQQRVIEVDPTCIQYFWHYAETGSCCTKSSERRSWDQKTPNWAQKEANMSIL